MNTPQARFQRLCVWCTRPFTPAKGQEESQRFCCPQHRLAWHGERRKRMMARVGMGEEVLGLTREEWEGLERLLRATPLAVPGLLRKLELWKSKEWE